MKDSVDSEIEYAVISNVIDILSVMCVADPVKIIDSLTGFLWDEEEAGSIKKSSGKFDIGEFLKKTRHEQCQKK